MTAQETSGIGAAKALAGVSAAVLGTALIGNALTRGRPKTMRWYKRLEKPGFTPPGAVFPMVWTALYALMAASAWRVAQRPASPQRNRALGLWLVQLALNAAWTPLFFGARRPAAALADIGLLLPAIAAYTAASARVDRPAAWMMAPYLGWVGFASAINAEIVRRNR